MSDEVLIAIIGFLGVAVGVLVTYVIAIKKLPKEFKVMDSEEQENLSSALNSAVLAYNTSLTAANFQRKDFEDRIRELELESEEAKNGRAERLARISALEVNQADLQKQISQWEAKYSELEKKYTNSKKAIEILIKAMEDANMPLPEELKLLLGDSMAKIKAIK